MQLIEHEVDHAVMDAVAHGLGQQPAHERRDGFLTEPRDQGLTHQVADVLVADLAEPDRRDLGHLVDHPVYVGRLGQPPADPFRDARRRHPLADDPLLEEVLADELLQAPAEIVLAARDERRVRHR